MIAHVVEQQALGAEAERAEHGDGALLLGHHLDGQLGQSGLQRLHQRPARERAPDALRAPGRIDHQPHAQELGVTAVQGRELRRIEPDAHRVLALAVDAHVGNAGDGSPADFPVMLGTRRARSARRPSKPTMR